MKRFFGGIYKWDRNDYTKVSDNTNDIYNILNNAKSGEIFYLPPPGIGVKYKYDLKLLSEKLSSIKSIDGSPDYLLDSY